MTKNILSVFRAEKSGLVKKLAFKTPFGVFESVFKGKLKNSEPKPLKGEETLPATLMVGLVQPALQSFQTSFGDAGKFQMAAKPEKSLTVLVGSKTATDIDKRLDRKSIFSINGAVAPAKSQSSTQPVHSPAKVGESQAVATVQKLIDALGRVQTDVSAEINLNVENRGQWSVRAGRVENSLSLNITVNSEQAKEWLQARMAQLGAKTNKIEIEVSQTKSQETRPHQISLHEKLTTSTVLRVWEQTAASALNTEPESLASGLEVRMDSEGFGPVLLEITADPQALRMRWRPETSIDKDTVKALPISVAAAGDVEEPQPGANMTKLSELIDVVVGRAKEPRVSSTKNQPASSIDVKSLLPVLLKEGVVTIAASNLNTSAQDSQPDATTEWRRIGVQKHAEKMASRRNEINSDEPAMRTPDAAKELFRSTPTDSSAAVLKNETAQATLFSNLSHLEFSGPGSVTQLIAPQQVQRSAMPEMIERIIEIAEAQSHSLGEKIEVQMEVDELGMMRVDATRRHHQVDLQIRVDNSETGRLIESQLLPLLEQMQKDGIAVGKLEVSVREHRFEHKPHGDFSPEDQRFQRRFSGSADSGAASAFSEPANGTPKEPRQFGYNSIEVLI
ncbi:MAG TPA: flagellar hook-length control protein FliK [bacterium]